MRNAIVTRPVGPIEGALLFCLLATFGAGPAVSADARPATPTALPSLAAWNGIRALGAPPPGSLSDQEKWILGSMGKASARFWGASDGSDLRAVAREYVGRFGRDGAAADFDWMLTSPDLLLASDGVVIQGFKKWSQDRAGGEFIEGLREAQRELCRAEVERFVADPKAFERYYQAVLWSGMFFRSQEGETGALSVITGRLRDGFPGAPDEDYWPYSRALIMLIHATGRDDLLAGTSPSDLRRVFFAWEAWLDDKQVFQHLKPDSEKFVWRYDPSLPANPASVMPVRLPDRPFPEMKAPLVVGTDFYVLTLDWGESDQNTRVLLKRLLSPVGHARTLRKTP